MYNNHRRKFLAEQPRQNWTYPYEVATVWKLSFREIEKNPHANLLLNLFAFLNPDEIGLDFLSTGITGDAEDDVIAPLRDMLSNSNDL